MQAFGSPPGQPRVSIIVPVTGQSPDIDRGLRSLLEQDYGPYELITVTSGAEDPASGIVEALQAERGHTGTPVPRLVFSGHASQCGQKNFALLAGVRHADAACGIYVFCDAHRVAPRTWLTALVAPISEGAATVATGYHDGLPCTRGLAVLGRAVTIAALGLLQRVPRFAQPWGGSTAISRAAFDELDVPSLWATNIVDDVSLARRLTERRTPVQFVAGARLQTPLGSGPPDSWCDWLTRQLAYLKWLFPVEWAAMGAGLVFLGLATAALPVALLAYAAGLAAAAPIALLAVVALIALGFLVAATARLHPRPGPIWRWLIAAHLAILVAGWCHARSLFTRQLQWRGIEYRVARGGRVREIIHAAPGTAPGRRLET